MGILQKMQKKNLTNDTVARNMLKKIRSLTHSEILREQNETNALPSDQAYQNLKDGIENVNGVDVKILSTDRNDLKLSDQHKQTMSGIIDTFKQQVSQIAEFDPGFTVQTDQIRLDGTLTDEDISFVFIAGKEEGVYINANMLKLEQSIASELEKLAKFQISYAEAMEPLISQRKSSIV